MPPKVDLTDTVKLCMVSDLGDDVSARKMLRERRKAEVRTLYEKTVDIREQRDPARNVINNAYHQQLENDAHHVPVVYRLLAHQYSGDTQHDNVPVAFRPRESEAAKRPATGTQTIVGLGNEPTVSTPPQRMDPKMEDILAAAKSVKQKTSLGIAKVDQATGREVRSIAVDANPSDIIRATMHHTSRPTTGGMKLLEKPSWTATRTLQTNTDRTGMSWDKGLRDAPKMGTITLKLQHKEVPDELLPGPQRSLDSARRKHRPQDSLFIF